MLYSESHLREEILDRVETFMKNNVLTFYHIYISY